MIPSRIAATCPWDSIALAGGVVARDAGDTGADAAADAEGTDGGADAAERGVATVRPP